MRRFLGIHDASYEFARGINVIVGPNEAGKSTLRAAMRTVLYGNAATTSPAKRDAFTSWGVGDPPELVLEFEVNGKAYTLAKDFARRTVVLRDGIGRAWDNHKVVQERVGVEVGLPSEELFVATAQVAQAELERIHVGSVAKELGRMISGGGEDVVTATRRLDQRVRAMEKGSKGQPIKEPGVLRVLEDRLASLRAAHQRLVASTAEAERKRALREETHTARQRTADELEAKGVLLELNRGMLLDEDRLQGLRREERMLEERLKNINENLSKLDTIDRGLEAATAEGVPDEAAVAGLRVQHGRIQGIETQRVRLLSTLQNAPGRASEHPDGWRVALVVLGASGGLLGLLAGLIGYPRLALVLAGAGIGVAMAGLVALVWMAQARRLQAIRMEERRAQLTVLDEELAQSQRGLAKQLARIGAAGVAEVEARFERYQGLVRDRGQIAAFVAELRSGNSDEDIAERWKVVRRDIFVIEERLRAPENADKRLTPLQVQVLERDVARLRQELSQLEERESRLSWELEQLAADAEALPGIEEELQEAEDAWERARHRHAVYRAALAGLEEARRLAEVPARKVMEDRAAEYLRVLSGGRYRRVQVEEETLGLRVWSDDAGDWVEAQEPHLSRGTVDLVYLSARLALVHVLAGEKLPPLLFDDPFVTFDEDRRAAVAELLKQLSQSSQIFLFTCSHEYERYADQVIDLTLLGGEPSPVLQSQQPATPSVGPLWDRLS